MTWRGYFDQDVWALGYFKDLRHPPGSKHVHPVSALFQDLASGTLKQFSWVQPSMHIHLESFSLPNWQHPWAPIHEGEHFLKQIFDAVRASKLWNKTALIVTYDEHGGFADHVSPPETGVPPPDSKVGRKTTNEQNRSSVQFIQAFV